MENRQTNSIVDDFKKSLCFDIVLSVNNENYRKIKLGACFQTIFWLSPDTGSVLKTRICAALAQLVEHVIRNDGVAGSIPACGTTHIFPIYLTVNFSFYLPEIYRPDQKFLILWLFDGSFHSIQ